MDNDINPSRREGSSEVAMMLLRVATGLLQLAAVTARAADARTIALGAQEPFQAAISSTHVADDTRPYTDNEIPAEQMKLHVMHKSGAWADKMDLTFFSDGCTLSHSSRYLPSWCRL